VTQANRLAEVQQHLTAALAVLDEIKAGQSCEQEKQDRWDVRLEAEAEHERIERLLASHGMTELPY
jgi:hypothetical protein